MEVIHDYFGPQIALQINMTTSLFADYLALLLSLHIPTFTTSLAPNGSPEDTIFFYASPLFFAFIFGLSVRNRSGFCRVWAAFVVVVCGCVLAARMANDLDERTKAESQARDMEVHEARKRLAKCLDELKMRMLRNV